MVRGPGYQEASEVSVSTVSMVGTAPPGIRESGAGLVRMVGIDLDGHDGYRLVYFLVRLRGYCSAVRCYYTKHGFHLVGTLREGVDRSDSLVVRGMCGDDGDRVWFDSVKLGLGEFRVFDRLFDVRLKDGETYSRKEFDPFRGVESRQGDRVPYFKGRGGFK